MVCSVQEGGDGMLLDVICSPTELPAAFAETPGADCAVIDVVRATTTLLLLAERGARRCFVVPTLPAARDLAARTGALLAGEEHGLKPAGFAFGNSPHEIAQADVAGREFVLATTNGTRALVAAQAAGAGTIAVAALRNAGAVALHALRSPADGAFFLVCAGRGDRVALDDLFTAGTIVALARRLAVVRHQSLALGEGAQIAAQIAETAGEPLDALSRSDAGRGLLEIGLGDDLAYCAAINATDRVPRVTLDEPSGALAVVFAEVSAG